MVQGALEGWKIETDALAVLMKSEFLTHLKIQEGEKEGTWFLLEPLIYRSEILKGEIAIPKGFVTDLASVPRVPIFYMLFGDRAHHESIPHDFFYQTHQVTKAIADKVFLEAMKARGKSFGIYWPMYMGVVLGGRSSYKSGPERFKVLNS